MSWTDEGWEKGPNPGNYDFSNNFVSSVTKSNRSIIENSGWIFYLGISVTIILLMSGGIVHLLKADMHVFTMAC